MTATRYLSKSRFKQGHECPTKLFYTGKREYFNTNSEDEFLLALAEGGYQVGELAKLYYPGGIEITEKVHEKAFEETLRLMDSGTPHIFEASLLYQNLYARVDILSKESDTCYRLIEVKSKSYDGSEDHFFKKQKGKSAPGFISTWEPYLYDVAFQTHVAKKTFPHLTFKPYLLLANKESVATVNRLNQLFPVHHKENGQIEVERPNLTPGTEAQFLGAKFLVEVDVSKEVEFILEQALHEFPNPNTPFAAYVEALALAYQKDQKALPTPRSKKCKNCEYNPSDSKVKEGYKSGFKECWKEAFRTNETTLAEPLITELWNYRKADELLISHHFLLKDLPEHFIEIKETDRGLSSTARQLLQLQKVKNKDTSIYFDREGLKQEMESWVYPLHFIDFETTSSAIPFHKGQHPFESIAFQFSHHQMEKDGTFHHAHEFLFSKIGENPNLEFVRALKKAVDGTAQGTILRYSNHENTILVHLKSHIAQENPSDSAELIEFINDITTEKTEKTSSAPKRHGKRTMVDLWDLLKRYYYDPRTRGSNSLKAVFPAILERSAFLKEKYSQPIYGSTIRSFNFKDKAWVTFNEDGTVINPYKTLPHIFTDVSIEAQDRLFYNEDLIEGGSASVAYARMQFEKMKPEEREAIRKALLRYCELDTLAMVMLVEHWQELLR